MPGDAFGRDVAELGDERLHRDAAHRVADEHGVVQVERLEHGAQVVREVLDGVARRAEHRLPVATVVVRDRAEARRGSDSSW